MHNLLIFRFDLQQFAVERHLRIREQHCELRPGEAPMRRRTRRDLLVVREEFERPIELPGLFQFADQHHLAVERGRPLCLGDR